MNLSKQTLGSTKQISPNRGLRGSQVGQLLLRASCLGSELDPCTVWYTLIHFSHMPAPFFATALKKKWARLQVGKKMALKNDIVDRARQCFHSLEYQCINKADIRHQKLCTQTAVYNMDI